MIWLLFKFVLHPLADPPGSQGRLLQWHPGACESKRKALPAYCPDLLARFCKETSLAKQEMLPDLGLRFCLIILTSPHIPAKEITRLDHMDIGARQENLAVRGEPIMLQLCVVPAYALTIHKVSVCCYARWSMEKTKLAPDPSIVDQTLRHRLHRGGRNRERIGPPPSPLK